MAHDEFHGVFPYLVSPVDERGRVRDAVLTRLVNDLIDAGVHGFTPLGSTGEVAHLNREARPRLLDGVVAYFTAMANATALPVVLYTNPQFQRSDLTLPAIERLVKVDNIRYLKDASSDTGRLLSIINAVGDRIRVFSASAHIPACVMLIGGVGWMAAPRLRGAPAERAVVWPVPRRQMGGGGATAAQPLAHESGLRQI